MQPESREQKVRDVETFLQKLGIDKMSIVEKMQLLKNLPFKKFLRIILLGHNTFSDRTISIKTWQAVKSTISTFGLVLDYEPPENAEQCLEKAYGEVQQNITPENYKDCAARLYTAVLFAHMLEDGNGRISRGVYSLLTRDGVPAELNSHLRLSDNDKITLGYDEPRKIGNMLVRNALARILTRNGLPIGKVSDLALANLPTDEGKISLKIHDGNISGMRSLMGNMAFLQFIAAKKVLESEGQRISFRDKISLDELSKDQIAKYHQHYNELREELYFEIQSLQKSFPKETTQAIDEGLFPNSN